MDGVGVPHLVLEMFVKRYITPNYPGVALDNTICNGDRIDTATLGTMTDC